MLKRTFVTVGVLAVLSLRGGVMGQSNLTAKNNNIHPQPVSTVIESDRLRDGLVGPVRRVRTEIVKLTNQGGRSVEGKRTLLEVAAYDIKGRKTENQYFPVDGATLTGKEVYKYDDKGNISEMTLVNDDGSLLSKELYKYEFDFAGNWNKMITSVGVIDAGRVSFEPTEVTYRSIMYYLNDNMTKMIGGSPSSATAANTTAAKPVSNTSASKSGENRKGGAQLPEAETSLDDISIASSPELKTVSSNVETKTPQVMLDNEPPPPARTILKPVSGGVLNGAALNLPAPTYPESAKRMRVGGTVVVEVVIDELGKVISAKASGGPAALREASVQAALHARFSPTKLSGQPVKVTGVINYRFSLTP
jgi:TonB family protein